MRQAPRDTKKRRGELLVLSISPRPAQVQDLDRRVTGTFANEFTDTFGVLADRLVGFPAHQKVAARRIVLRIQLDTRSIHASPPSKVRACALRHGNTTNAIETRKCLHLLWRSHAQNPQTIFERLSDGVHNRHLVADGV